MNEQIVNYISKNYNELKVIAKRITKNHDLTDDLLQDVLLQILERGKIILHNFNDDTIKYYIVSIIRINWHSKTSPFFYRIKREICLYSPLKDNVFDIPDNDTQAQFEREILYDVIETSWTDLDWFHKSLFEMYMCMGSMNKVSKKTKIPISSIRRYINEGKEQMKTDINIKINI